MNICIVTPFFYPFLSGASVRHYKHAKALQGAGHTVSLLSPYKGVSDIACYKTGWPPVYLHFGVWKKIFELNRKKKIDVVLSQGWIADVMSFIPAKLIGARFFCDIHGPEKIEVLASQKNRMKRGIALFGTWLDGFILRKAEKLFVAEDEVIKWLGKEYNVQHDKMVLLANYPDLKLFYPRDTSNKHFTIGYLGSLQQGRIDPLLEIAGQLKEYRFVVVGEGDAVQEIQRYPNITHLSEQRYSEIPSVLSQFSVGIIFSLTPKGMQHKGPPMKVYEYLACGLPVIAVNLPELHTIISQHKVGIITDITGLKEAIQSMHDHYDTYQSHVARYRTIMEQETDWQNEKKKFIEEITLH